jgi:putative transposase
MDQQPKRPPRLREIFQKYRHPIYFVTFGTKDRKKILANPPVDDAFIRFARNSEKRGTIIGRYVIMPDHVHLFIRLNQSDHLGATIGFLKKSLTRTLSESGHASPHWQPGFFDHLLRSANSYSEKWDYVQKNPLRAGLIEDPADWPYAGEINTLSF